MFICSSCNINRNTRYILDGTNCYLGLSNEFKIQIPMSNEDVKILPDAKENNRIIAETLNNYYSFPMKRNYSLMWLYINTIMIKSTYPPYMISIFKRYLVCFL